MVHSAGPRRCICGRLCCSRAAVAPDAADDPPEAKPRPRPQPTRPPTATDGGAVADLERENENSASLPPAPAPTEKKDQNAEPPTPKAECLCERAAQGAVRVRLSERLLRRFATECTDPRRAMTRWVRRRRLRVLRGDTRGAYPPAAGAHPPADAQRVSTRPVPPVATGRGYKTASAGSPEECTELGGRDGPARTNAPAARPSRPSRRRRGRRFRPRRAQTRPRAHRGLAELAAHVH